MASEWLKKFGTIAGNAAQGYDNASQHGLAGSLASAAMPMLRKKKKKNNLIGNGKETMGSDPGGETKDLSTWRIGLEASEDQDEFLHA